MRDPWPRRRAALIVADVLRDRAAGDGPVAAAARAELDRRKRDTLRHEIARTSRLGLAAGLLSAHYRGRLAEGGR